MIVRDAVINVPAKALLVIGAERIDLNDRECLTSLLAAWKSNYQLTGNPDSCFASMPLAPGSTHMHTWDADGNYTWHRYRSINRCIFLAVSIEA